jgi:hypothetical protein
MESLYIVSLGANVSFTSRHKRLWCNDNPAVDKECYRNIKELPHTKCSADYPLHAYLWLNLCRGPRVAIMMGKKYSQDRAEFRETGRVFDNQERVFAVLLDNRQRDQ